MFGFAKRTGFEGGEQYPKEFYDIMNMLDNAAVKYGQHVADPTGLQVIFVSSQSVFWSLYTCLFLSCLSEKFTTEVLSPRSR